MQGPYRPQATPPDPELARLAMEGHRRRMELATGQKAEQSTSGKGHLRTAIGAYRGSTIKRIVLVVMIGAAVLGVLGITLSVLGLGDIGEYLIPGLGVAFLCIFLMAFVPPLAAAGAVGAERDWMMALPFQLTGYFELLSSQPIWSRKMDYEIAWRDGTHPPDRNLLHGIVGAVDPQALLVRCDARGAHIRSGAVSGSTGITVNRSAVYRNHRFCKSIHGVVDQVLVPLHRTYPIAQVKVS